ncbi:MAG: GGDEF domain-containing protein [Clostridia bacterium]|nr:GGDEF domain-containing protein [Clostridia bacterium]
MTDEYSSGLFIRLAKLRVLCYTVSSVTDIIGNEGVVWMAIKYGKKKKRLNHILSTVVTGVLVCAIFLVTVGYFYQNTETEAYENLHIQTKQIKDDLMLQITSDRENLVTMANFAAKLYADGESYDLMFESFKPIGLFSMIGILNPDNTFVTKMGKGDLNGKISFQEEAARGIYISGRVKELTGQGDDIIRSAVPIVVNNETVGILYGVIKLEVINFRYSQMAKELDAQLFVYDKDSGDLIIDTISENPGNISFLKNRTYLDGYSYEEMVRNEKGFSSFRSAYTNENLYVHYSIVENTGWGIVMARYESQVFSKTHLIFKIFLCSFLLVMGIIVLYILLIVSAEKKRAGVTAHASYIRKLLLEINQQHGNISEALKNTLQYTSSQSAFFVGTDGEDFEYALPAFTDVVFMDSQRQYLIQQMLHYAAEFHRINQKTVGFLNIKPNSHLVKTNVQLYDFLKQKQIRDIAFATVIDKNNHISVLGVLNPRKAKIARILLEDIAVCFSIAIYNKKHLNQTETEANTDALTGVLNRVSYKRDILQFDAEQPQEFSCIYIDVNELHLRNNRYGHAAGDEMLIFIANTLKEVFFGQHIYRMGGDEFLVFVEKNQKKNVQAMAETFVERLQPKDYHVAIGMSYREQEISCEAMVTEAETRMYEAKAAYYQGKERANAFETEEIVYVSAKTGLTEIDTLISILKDHYHGIYRVCLETDVAHRILMPSYLEYGEDENEFSHLYKRYVDTIVHPDFRRPLLSFLNYEAIKAKISEGEVPQITYQKVNGDSVILSVYGVSQPDSEKTETLWVFAKD